MSDSLQDRWDRKIAAVVASAAQRPGNDASDEDWDEWAGLLAGPSMFFESNRARLSGQGGRVGLGDDDVVPQALAIAAAWLQRNERPAPAPPSPVPDPTPPPPEPSPAPPSPVHRSPTPPPAPVPRTTSGGPGGGGSPSAPPLRPRPKPVGHRGLVPAVGVAPPAKPTIVIPPAREDAIGRRSESPDSAAAIAERSAQPRKVRLAAMSVVTAKGLAKAKVGKGKGKQEESVKEEAGTSKGRAGKGKAKEEEIVKEGSGAGKPKKVPPRPAVYRVMRRDGEERVEDGDGKDLGPFQRCDYCTGRPELVCTGIVGETCYDCRHVHKTCSNNPGTRRLRSAAAPAASSSQSGRRAGVSVSRASLKRRATSPPGMERESRRPRLTIRQGDARAGLLEMQRLAMDMFRVLGVVLANTAVEATGVVESGTSDREEEGEEEVEGDEDMEVDEEEEYGA
ncbi:hypothetical protein Hypma_005804 [Hypsizygus marmoreus]|uniref:Uncharacterized protein n=1 Tax=Hypsizygus marmoreus TaxID=39966 RepID=A0A369KBI3_HYPMA|nr:hypothetical protein Hypma_005804 [Hypsizygus marmoreus]